MVIRGIDEWRVKHGSQLNLMNLKLIENIDYFISLPSFENSSASIRCSCRASANLFKFGNHLQLSHYYRHLKKGKCSMLESKVQSSSLNDYIVGDDVNNNETLISTQSKSVDADRILVSSAAFSSSRSKRATSINYPTHRSKKRQKK